MPRFPREYSAIGAISGGPATGAAVESGLGAVAGLVADSNEKRKVTRGVIFVSIASCIVRDELGESFKY